MRAREPSNPANRFLSTALDYDPGEGAARVVAEPDAARSILSENDSPDLSFRFSANPYRGCQHACAYCYARPTHEYLGLGAGTDFDTRIRFKPEAARLLREAFGKPSWRGEPVTFSGVTDCYQPLEQRLELTRACLQVCLEHRNPVGIVTKGVLIERDVELLLALQREAGLHLKVSIPFWNEEKARAMEPWVATPRRRIEAVRRLTEAGLEVGVMVAPVIPGLSDEDIGKVIEAAAEAGARHAHYVLLRLPGSLKQLFEERLRRDLPLQAERVMNRVRETRDGDLYDARFGVRGTGTGPYAQMIASLFEAACRKHGLNCGPLSALDRGAFRVPGRGVQLGLF